MSEECGDVGEHIDVMLDLFRVMGIGGACEKQYKALLELAEVQRLVHDFAPYVPVLAPDIAAKSIAIKMAMEAADGKAKGVKESSTGETEEDAASHLGHGEE